MHVSKYIRIVNDLRRGIESGQYRPGDTLPSESELVNRYEVARGTVRQAVSVLANEGLVTPMPGVGTVIRETAAVALSYTAATPSPAWSRSNADDETARDELVVASWEPADHDIAERLAVNAGDLVLYRVRHQHRGRDIAQVHEQWIPRIVATAITGIGADLADTDNLPTADLFELMKQAGHPPFETTETIGARMPDPGEREVMRLPIGVPVLTTLRTTRAEDGTPLETSDFASAADRCTQAFTVSLRGR